MSFIQEVKLIGAFVDDSDPVLDLN